MNKLPGFGLVVAAAASCTQGSTHDDDRLVIHEWGTFTSMVGADGKELEGLHHEEEALPPFVYGRDPSAGRHKAMEVQPSGVTQKLETPVLYFYTSRPRDISITVDFPDGIVSEWFPDASTFAPEVGRLAGMRGGSMTWSASIVPGIRRAEFPAIEPDSIWAPSRDVASTPVRVGDEREQFIFYRGLGAFTTQMNVTARTDGTLALANRSAEPIDHAFLLHVHDGGASIKALGAIRPGSTITVEPPPLHGKERNIDSFVGVAADQIAAALVTTGLTRDESRAMVDTWSKSYFREPGLRVLYVVPRPWTDRLLPIRFSSQPHELVRTLVGRVEVLTPAIERELVAQVEAAAAREALPHELVPTLGRFAEPKLRRVEQLMADATLKSYLAPVIEYAAAMP